MIPSRPSAPGSRMLTGAVVACGLLLAAGSAGAGVKSSSCPPNAILIEPGALTQATVDLAGDGAEPEENKALRPSLKPKPNARSEKGRRSRGSGVTRLVGVTTFVDMDPPAHLMICDLRLFFPF